MKWAIDPMHSAANFTIRHLLTKVRGSIGVKEGWVEAENDHTTATVNVTLDSATVYTGVQFRDNDLRSPNFFDVEKHPTITFKSKRIEGNDPSKFKVIGDLSMHGVTKEITLEATFGGEMKGQMGERRVSFSGRTKLNRKDFGLTWNQAIEGGGWLVGDEVDVELEVETLPQEAWIEMQKQFAAAAARK